jgi:hypothetical protein
MDLKTANVTHVSDETSTSPENVEMAKITQTPNPLVSDETSASHDEHYEKSVGL